MSIESFANQHVLELVAYQPGKPIEETESYQITEMFINNREVLLDRLLKE